MSASLVGTPTVADSGSGGTITEVDPAWPVGVASGDRAFLVAGDLNNTSILAAGFTGDAQQLIGSGGARMFRRTCDGTESGTVAVTLDGTGSRVAAGLFVVTGAGAPTEAEPTIDSEGTPTIAVPTITPPEDGCLLVVAAWLNHTAGTTPTTTGPSGYTQDATTVTSNGSGRRAGLWIGHKQLGADTAGVAQNSGLTIGTSATAVQGMVWAFAFPAAGSPPPEGPPAGWVEVRLFTPDA